MGKIEPRYLERNVNCATLAFHNPRLMMTRYCSVPIPERVTMAKCPYCSAMRQVAYPLHGEYLMRAIGWNYFVFFAVFGIFLPFVSPLLEEMGFLKVQIGWIQGGVALCAVLSPILFTRLSDRFFSADQMLQICALLMSIQALILLFSSDHRLVFLLALFLYAIFRAPVVPLQDALAMQAVGDLPKRYARLRVLGSIGFALAALLAGMLIHKFGLKSVLWMLFGGSIVLWICSLFLPKEPRRESRKAPRKFWRALKTNWWGWLAAMACHWFCFGPFHYGFTFLLQESEVPRAHHGVYWSLGIVTEIAVFLSSGWFFRHFDFRTLLFVSFGANLARWLAIGIWPVAAVIGFSQLLHGFGFGLFYAAALQGIAKYSRGRDRASFQGLFTMMIAGVANVCGTTAAGSLHQIMPFSDVVLAMVPAQILALVLLFFFPLIRAGKDSTPMENDGH